MSDDALPCTPERRRLPRYVQALIVLALGAAAAWRARVLVGRHTREEHHSGAMVLWFALPPGSRRSWRLSARFVAAALDRRAGRRLVVGLVLAYGSVWTLVLSLAKAAQDLHNDTTEAYAWGQMFLFGYGKHPPVSGWLAGLWFRLFPAADWAMYGLVMATNGIALVAVWLTAERVVDRRRSVLVVLLLMVYPIFHLKGCKFNADQVQIAALAIAVLTFLIAFETRRAAWGAALGLAAAAAVLTKYWAGLMIVAFGIATLTHPDGLRFLRSPAPYVAAAVFLAAVSPHVIWLVWSDFAPFAYAVKYHPTVMRDYAASAAVTYLKHHAAFLLSVPAALAVALGTWRTGLRRHGDAPVRLGMARHIWVVLATLTLLPPMLGVTFKVQIRSDWGIPLFFLAPLALLAWPRLTVSRRALLRGASVVAVLVATALTLAPIYAEWAFVRSNERFARNGLVAAETTEGPATGYVPRSELADPVTRLWRDRFGSPLPTVAAPVEIAVALAFYSPDHPTTFSDIDPRISTWTDVEAMQRSGFIGICPAGETACETKLAHITAGAERIELTTRRSFRGHVGPEVRWNIWVQPPAAEQSPAHR